MSWLNVCTYLSSGFACVTKLANFGDDPRENLRSSLLGDLFLVLGVSTNTCFVFFSAKRFFRHERQKKREIELTRYKSLVYPPQKCPKIFPPRFLSSCEWVFPFGVAIIQPKFFRSPSQFLFFATIYEDISHFWPLSSLSLRTLVEITCRIRRVWSIFGIFETRKETAVNQNIRKRFSHSRMERISRMKMKSDKIIFKCSRWRIPSLVECTREHFSTAWEIQRVAECLFFSLERLYYPVWPADRPTTERKRRTIVSEKGDRA